MFICRIVEDRNIWNQFVASQEKAQFLQSWEWGEFQKKMGRRVWRVGIFDDVLVGAAQIIEHYLGLGMGYLYAPRGPVCKSQIPNPKSQINSNDQISKLIDFLPRQTPRYGELFLRVEPLQNIQYLISNPPAGEAGIQYFRVPSIQPSRVLLLDLSQSEETLLAAMHPKTRYNIRLAQKKGLEFRIMNYELGIKKKDFESFWSLMQETAKRDKIRIHSRRYYDWMNKTLAVPNSNIPASPAGRQYLISNIQYFNQWLAAGVFIGFGDTFTYVHGASSSQRREMMAPHLLHWEAIKFAKKAGYRYYDFGGVNPENKQDFDYRPSWEGITRFKSGFGGFVHSYPGTYDVVLNKLGYKIYQSAREINCLVRHPPL